MDAARLRDDSTFLAAACILEQVDIVISAGLVEPRKTRLLLLDEQPTRKSESVSPTRKGRVRLATVGRNW